MGTPALRSAFIISIIAITGCDAPDRISDSGLEVMAARASSGPSYSPQEIGFLEGHDGSAVNDVNDAGYIVGWSYPSAGGPTAARAFIRTGSTMSVLGTGNAMAVSNGSPVYVAGQDWSTGDTRIARWTFDPTTGAVTEEIVEELGVVADINNAGTMIGTTGGVATLVSLDGVVSTVPPSSGFESSTGKGVNNAGHAGVTFRAEFSRAQLLVDGTLIELPPAGGHTMSFAGKVSDPVGGFVYVSGVSASNVDTDYHLTRWKVDVANKIVVNAEVRREVSEGSGVSSDGTIPAMIEGKSSPTAAAWTLSSTIALKPTKGGSAPQTAGISPNGRYIVGSGIYKLRSRALLWTRTP